MGCGVERRLGAGAGTAMSPEIVECGKAGNDIAQCGRDLRIRVVCVEGLAADGVGVDLGLKRGFDLRGGRAHFDGHVIAINAAHIHALRRQISRHRLQIGVRNTEALAEFFRREPLVIVRRVRILLRGEQRLKRRSCFAENASAPAASVRSDLPVQHRGRTACAPRVDFTRK